MNRLAMKNVLIEMAAILCLFSCGKDDKDNEWGFSKVYIPQAAIYNGGQSNIYPVPMSNNPVTDNYEIDPETGALRIVLGVYRSGLQKLDRFSVDVSADNEATAAAVTSLDRAVALPDELYDLPSRVTVDEGTRETIFYLTVDMNRMIEEYPDYGKKKIVLAVKIDNPTKYELNRKLATAIVVIDGKAFMPVPRIVKGGDFETGSEAWWTGHVKSGDVTIGNDSGISGGKLYFDYKTIAANNETWWSTKVTLEEGREYRFSCDFSSSSEGINTSTGCRFYILLRPEDPEAGFTYKDEGNTFYTMTDAWNGLSKPINGKLPQNGGWQVGIDKTTGTFTSTFSGTGWIVIGMAAWNSPTGRIEIDNISIDEK